MKSNKGITLMSLVVYIVGMIIVVAILTALVSYFSKNINIDDLKKTGGEYTKFSSVFTKEVNIAGNKVLECYTQGDGENKVSYIVFSTGNQYTYMAQDKSIFRNKIKICENVEDCEFSSEFDDPKYVITVKFKSENSDFTGDNAIKYYINPKQDNYYEEMQYNQIETDNELEESTNDDNIIAEDEESENILNENLEKTENLDRDN